MVQLLVTPAWESDEFSICFVSSTCAATYICGSLDAGAQQVQAVGTVFLDGAVI
jgi:hypothetical protein